MLRQRPSLEQQALSLVFEPCAGPRSLLHQEVEDHRPKSHQQTGRDVIGRFYGTEPYQVLGQFPPGIKFPLFLFDVYARIIEECRRVIDVCVCVFLCFHMLRQLFLRLS
jgi:hypothetical protein